MGTGRSVGAFANGFANSFAQGMSIFRQKEQDERQNARLDEQMEMQRRREEREQVEHNRKIQGEDELQPHRIKLLEAQSAHADNLRADSAATRQQNEALRSALSEAYLDGQERRGKAGARSVLPIEAQGPVAPVEGGRRLPQAFKVDNRTFLDRDEAFRAAEAAAGTVFSHISGPYVDAVKQAYVAAGQMDKAEAFGKWIEHESTQEGIRHFASGVGQLQAGNIDGGLSSIKRAFNGRYYDDGRSVDFDNVQRDQNGQPAAMDVTFTNRAGKQEVMRGMTMQQVQELALSQLAPLSVFNTAVNALDAERAQKAKIAEARALEQAKADGKRAGEGGGQSNPYATGGFNEGQGKAATFADRMAEAEAILGQHQDINSGADGWIGGTLANTLPAGAANQIASPERQQFNQAQRNFVNAVLRRESGAAIAQSEFDNAARQYFAQPGDNPQVIEQKRQNRMTAIHGLMREAGPSYRPPKGWEDPRNPPGGRPQAQQGVQAQQQPNYAPGGGPSQPGQAMQGQQQMPGSLAPGAVVNGFIYRGGNPKDQNSWERAQ